MVDSATCLGANSRYLATKSTYWETEEPRTWGNDCAMKRTLAARTIMSDNDGCLVRKVNTTCSPVLLLWHNTCALLDGVAKCALFTVGVVRVENFARPCALGGVPVLALRLRDICAELPHGTRDDVQSDRQRRHHKTPQ